ncbi:hypothetical protein SLS62_005370 [Diatrype stigma]|uniref:glucan 1,3-beta-glucosidase n=1 Tax=Diatrype stigma TaxID=117547 RepID=A0AAN9YPQ7_9PEZI
MALYRIFPVAIAAIALLVGTSIAVPPHAFSEIKRDLKFNFGVEKIRGVNLGGWLLLEPWITPSIFEATAESVLDEYTFAQSLGPDEARSRLEKHWSSWITEGDFYDIASKGLNFVRIPIGYWAVRPIQGEPYVQGAYGYLEKALYWAQNANLKVIIDLHGAPLSQNGFDNSGKRGGVQWGQGDSVANTLATINKIRDDFASHPAVAAIELLNEPMGPQLDMNMVRQFVADGWRNLQGSSVAVAFHDAFVGVTSWNDWGNDMLPLLLDTHHYEVFDAAQLSMNIDGHVGTACGFGTAMASSNKWTVAGEWTGAMTDCAKWLNGRGVGARYDGTFNFNGQTSQYIGSCEGKSSGTVEQLTEADRANIQRYISAQMTAYEKAAGWIFWAWKTEAAPEWDFQKLANAGLIPQPLSSKDAKSEEDYDPHNDELNLLFELRHDLLDVTQFKLPLVSVNFEARVIALAWAREQGVAIHTRDGSHCPILVCPFDQMRDVLYFTHNQWDECIREHYDRMFEPDLVERNLEMRVDVKRMAVPEEALRQSETNILAEMFEQFSWVDVIFILCGVQPDSQLVDGITLRVQQRWELENAEGGAFFWNHDRRGFDFKDGERIPVYEPVYRLIEDASGELGVELIRSQIRGLEIRLASAIKV